MSLYSKSLTFYEVNPWSFHNICFNGMNIQKAKIRGHVEYCLRVHILEEKTTYTEYDNYYLLFAFRIYITI